MNCQVRMAHDPGKGVVGSCTHLVLLIDGRYGVHVCHLDDVLQVVVHVRNVRIDRDFILPLELGPHAAELGVRAGGWYDVVHYVYVNVVQDYAHPVTDRSRHIVH